MDDGSPRQGVEKEDDGTDPSLHLVQVRAPSL